MSFPSPPRDCEHGRLARKCETCADAREIAELTAELTRLRAENIQLQVALERATRAIELAAAQHYSRLTLCERDAAGDRDEWIAQKIAAWERA